MKKLVVVLALALSAFALGGAAQAASSGSISVSVMLGGGVIGVSLDQNNWALGEVTLGSASAPKTFVATVDNMKADLKIKGTDATGGWTLGTQGADTFEVDVTDPVLVLSKTDQALADDVPAHGTKSFDLTYKAPNTDTKGAGVDQGFTITVTAE